MIKTGYHKRVLFSTTSTAPYHLSMINDYSLYIHDYLVNPVEDSIVSLSVYPLVVVRDYCFFAVYIANASYVILCQFVLLMANPLLQIILCIDFVIYVE